MSWVYQPLVPAAAQLLSGGDPPVVDYVAAETSSALFRKNSVNRRLLVSLAVVQTEPPPENANRHTEDPFTTRVTKSRRQLSHGWMAGLAQVAVPALHMAAVFGSRTQRRRSTERRLVTVEDLQWQYIAPTVAAILPMPVAKVIEFKRTLRLVQPLDFLQPPTGPPLPSWLQAARKRVSPNKRKVWLLEQPAYPTTPVAPLGQQSEQAFVTKSVRSRRLQKSDLSVGVIAGVATPPPNAVLPAFLLPKQFRRHGSGGSFAVAVVSSALETAVTEAVYSSFVLTGFIYRRGTERRLLVSPDILHVAPADAPEAEGSSPGFKPFVTKVSRSRRSLSTAFSPGVVAGAAPPPTTAAVYPSFVQAGHFRRHGSGGSFAVSIAVSALPPPVPAVYPSFVPVGYHKRRSTERKLRLATGPLHVEAAIYIVPPEAVRIVKALFRRATDHNHQSMGGPLHVEAAPPPVIVIPPGGDDKPPRSKHEHPGWDKKRALLKRSEELRLAEDVRDIYRRLTGREETAQRAKDVVAPLAPAGLEMEDAKRLSSLAAQNDKTAIDIELALRLLNEEVQRIEQEEDDLAMQLILAVI